MFFVRVKIRYPITEYLLDYFNISFANAINPTLFTLASGKFFRQCQKPANFIAKMSQEQSL